MSLYFDIMRNISKLDKNLFSYNYLLKTDKNICVPVQSSYKHYYTNRVFYKSKYEFLNKNYVNDDFMKKLDLNDDFFTFFSTINRLYFALNRFAHIYKYKKSKIVVDTDLCLNKIQLREPETIEIFQENKKYLFRLHELISIINSALTNAPGLFCEPLLIKNPYNNIPFNKSTLYNIYFSIKFHTKMNPDLFFKFFNMNFNLSRFFYEYEYLLKEYAIKNLIKNSSVEVLWSHVMDMIDDYNYSTMLRGCALNKIRIDAMFPKKRLVQIMKPYLNLHLISSYSLIGVKKNAAKSILYKKLKKFHNYNPMFGRKIVKCEMTDSGQTKLTHDFNDSHVKFNDIGVETFMKSHMINNSLETFDDHVTVEVSVSGRYLLGLIQNASIEQTAAAAVTNEYAVVFNPLLDDDDTSDTETEEHDSTS